MGRGGVKKKGKSRRVVPSALACLIYYCRTARTDVSNSSVVQFYGFVLDPNAEPHNCGGDGEELTPLSPRFRLDGLVSGNAQFCISNSILYMFDVYDYFTVDITKSVYSLDLSAVLNGSSTEMLVVEKGMFEKCSEMKCPKTLAKAIQTPKGKILIFSMSTTPVGGRDIFDFELFDPDTKQCRPLPQLPLAMRLSIKGYGFLSDTRFMISTYIHGFYRKFVLDLDGNGGWEENFRYPHTPSSYFMAYGNEIYSISGFVGIQACRATLPSGFDPPLSRLPDSVRRRFGPKQLCNHSHSICLLGADKELILCIAQAAFVKDERNDRPCILFDVYRSDSDPTRIKKASFRFTANIPGHLVTFISDGMFRANV